MKYFKLFGLIVLVCAIALVGWGSFVVLDARQKTQQIFNELLSDQNVVLNLADVPDDRIRQLLEIEDPNFYQHNGWDFSTPGAGLTTITQGMVKYLYFDNFKPGFLKIKQTLIAWLAVNPLVSKDDQLTVFINTAYLGNYENKVVKGFADAATTYFEKQFNELTDDEYLSLVAMLIGPNQLNVKYRPDQNRERVKKIKKVLSGEYKPKGLRDVYYGQSN
jgi:membrane carboxypeptidase/penicillin-binding protein